jgi:hypothetical protein
MNLAMFTPGREHGLSRKEVEKGKKSHFFHSLSDSFLSFLQSRARGPRTALIHPAAPRAGNPSMVASIPDSRPPPPGFVVGGLARGGESQLHEEVGFRFARALTLP